MIVTITGWGGGPPKVEGFRLGFMAQGWGFLVCAQALGVQWVWLRRRHRPVDVENQME